MSLNDLDNDGIALDGADPVAYFNGEGLTGTPEFTFELRGVTYRFANAANLEAFQADPAKYIPDFAGSYLRDPAAGQGQSADGQAHNMAPANARLESRGMLDDVIEPLDGTIDPELKNNPGYNADEREQEMSNLHDSEA